MFTRQVNVQNRETYFHFIVFQRKNLTLVGNKNLFIHFFLHRSSIFDLSTENVQAYSVIKGHQSVYSRVDRVKIDENNRSEGFPQLESTKIIHR